MVGSRNPFVPTSSLLRSPVPIAGYWKDHGTYWYSYVEFDQAIIQLSGPTKENWRITAGGNTVIPDAVWTYHGNAIRTLTFGPMGAIPRYMTLIRTEKGAKGANGQFLHPFGNFKLESVWPY